MNTKEKKHLASSLYIKTGLSRKDIAKQVSCTEKTLRKWIEIGQWDELRDAETITRPQLLRDSYKQLKAINNKINQELNGVPDKQLADAKGVIRKEIEALSDNPLHLYIEVFEELHAFIAKNYPEQLIKSTEMMNELIELRVNSE